MKADWDKLGGAWAKSDSVMIVDADCTAGAQGTCGSQGVKGYPTIKYYLDGKAKDYQGGRDYNALNSFVKSTLDKASCDIATGKGCKPIQQKFIEANKGKSLAELKEMEKERKDAFKQLEKEFKAKQKEFKTAEKKYKLASDLLKRMIKAGGSKKNKDEL